MNILYALVEPIIIYPTCLLSGNKQDCFLCQLKSTCKSPRSLCVKPYHNHKKGCPNYAKKPTCPPFSPMYDEVFDLNKPNYAIYIEYNLLQHMNKMKAAHPNWTEVQLRNVLYWQGTARKELRKSLQHFKELFSPQGYYITTSPEAMGVDVTTTLKNAGIEIEWPHPKIVRKVAFSGVPNNIEKYRVLFH